ncbi:hypothetical protein KR767_16445 [Luteibacter anthropi]|uniref:Uncharacterized protein n=1 Tax=Luteibacter anthropi TaxID=564369 RepID=A0A7X5U7N1_9GAMM|nr:hypothetical protein [Luteibacter anthropi]NII05396.1 hypothetical protein [Luteibacter anthropi]URX61637.1 hypothetical protein KR767_16445 [Luteibacter anthropi]
MLTPEGRARREAQDERIKKRIEGFRVEQRELLDELAAAGVSLEIVNDLPNWPSSDYVHTLPILARHLHRPYSQGTLASLARSMGMKEAAPYWDELVTLYRQQPEKSDPDVSDFGMGLAVAISASVPPSRLDELVELIKTPGLPNRVLLLGPIQRRRSRNRKYAELIEELRHDPVFSREIQRWKGMRRKSH